MSNKDMCRLCLYFYLSTHQNILRAVESNRYVVRASNTGITAIISPNGKIETSAECFVPTYIRQNVCINNNRTLYMICGDIVIIPGLLLIIYGIIYSFIKLIKKEPNTK